MDEHRQWGRCCCVAVIIGVLCCTSLYYYHTLGPENSFNWTLKTKPFKFLKAFQIQNRNSSRPVSDTELKNKHQILTLYRNVCHAYDSGIQILHPKIQFKSLVLVITLNNPLYEILPLVELVYRPLFPEIVYCISNGDKSRELKNWNLKIIYYKSPPSVRGGIYNYICVEYVHRLGLKADGFIFMSDDILVSPAAVAKFSKQPLPATPLCTHLKPYYNCTLSAPCKLPYINETSVKLAAMRRKLKLQPKDSVGPRCERGIQRMTGVKEPLVHCLPDIFFIPVSMMEDASKLFRQFYDHRVFHGGTVYYIMLCLSAPSYPNAWDYQDVHGKQRMDLTKAAPHVVSRHKMVVHPVKLSPLLNRTTKYDRYFCKKMLPFLHNAK